MKSLKLILPIGLCAVVVTGIVTANIRAEAKKQLQHEEMLSGIRNNQVLSQRKALADFEEEQRQAEYDRQFKRSIGIEDAK